MGTCLAASGLGTARDCSAFWHHGHSRLQDAVAMVSMLPPGWKWKNGFISTGLLSLAMMSP